jgi:hypothetical protein
MEAYVLCPRECACWTHASLHSHAHCVVHTDDGLLEAFIHEPDLSGPCLPGTFSALQSHGKVVLFLCSL